MKSDWFSCDGGGFSQPRVSGEEQLSRRNLFVAAGLGAISWLATRESALAQITLKPDQDQEQTLVVLFLRGGADGLNVVVPHGEDEYYKLRPSLAIPAPKNGAAAKDRAINLDGFFGLHPAMAPAYELFSEGDLSIVHAAGSFDQTRSHFDAMSAMERGLPQAAGTVSSGWLARYLNAGPGQSKSPLRAVAFGDVLPDSLRGGSGAVAMDSLGDFKLEIDAHRDEIEKALRSMYGAGKDEISVAGMATLDAMRSLNRLDPKNYRPGGGAKYPESDLGNGLKQVALLVKSGVGLEVACLDKGGWDTHVAQGSTTGWQASLMADLSSSLLAFRKDLGPRAKNVTTLVMTEFGRRSYENSGLGTDHGRGSFMMIMGGATRGGRVFAKWPGLKQDQLEGPGDLKVTTDYRNVLAEVLQRKMKCQSIEEVFPGIPYEAPGITA